MRSKRESLTLDTIQLGDSIELLRSTPDDSVDLIFADPPYYMQLTSELRRPDDSVVDAVDDHWDKFDSFADYDRFTREWVRECRRIMKKNASFWVIGTYHNIYRIGTILQDEGFWIQNDIVWIKSNPMPQFKGVRFCNAHETLIWAAKDSKSRPPFQYKALKMGNEDLQMRSDWLIPLCAGTERLRNEDGAKLHSTQKPEALLHRILSACTVPGDIVLDPFFGTGTSGAVAKYLGRHYIGFEREKEYALAAKERIAHVIPAPSEFLQPLVKPRRVAFALLVEAGMLTVGANLRLAHTDFEAIVRADGTLQHGDHIASIHSMGKLLLGAESCNGWDHWLYRDHVAQSWKSINNLREQIQFPEKQASETKTSLTLDF